ncbi:MAG: hypothetical protein HKP17_14845 [Ignavibacteriaceae bacterium]|nr:hypothetical protein [Ignavibacteria bacterium]MBT8391082.1 hypothetical protein [Ignavibacteria bacterium]NNJ54443.1 hypothetical protein [Ignavibacteriaceae bacterium]NNL19859.1 hypothetical protein [Ignavibacteriaceae bacterium]
MKKIFLLFFLIFFIVSPALVFLFAQDEDELIQYFQMEPLDDSLFIHIQQELFIDPPDPKAEIIADLRDPNNQTISIKGVLYPFLAVPPELRARVITYPFKINLEEDVHYGSVFTRVIEKIKIKKVLDPPTKQQIGSTLWYINPFLQLFGGERFGIPIKKDIGLSLGILTRYEGPLNTNFLEANFHILGVYGGAFSNVDAIITSFKDNNHNNLIFTNGIQIGYVIPFGNFFEISFLSVIDDFSANQRAQYLRDGRGTVVYNTDGSVKYQAWLVEGSFLNWEFRYPVKMLGATKGRVYVAQYLDEWHFGFDFREMSLAGSTFDFQFDAMPSSKMREPQYVITATIQKIAESWAFSAFSIGPSIILGRLSDGSFGVYKIFANMRFKLGSSL